MEMTLIEWLQEKTYYAKDIALRERGHIWDIWDLLWFVQRAAAIPKFPLGQMLKGTHVYEEGHWLISEEDGRLLYEIIANPLPRPIVSITGRVIQG
jgi:hypothetical protein